MKLYLSIFVMLILATSYAQKENINLIISIDEKIPTSNLTIKYIAYKGSDGKLQKYDNLEYIQGNLSISKEAFDRLVSDEVKEAKLYFKYWEYCKDEKIDYDYEIDLKNSYFKFNYLILYIYNLNKKKYRKIYFPTSENKNYAYYFDYPSNYKGTLVQKKLTKEQRRCN